MKLENNVNANIVEKILGHKNGLDGVYFTPTMEECFAEFKKAIQSLTISDKNRDELKIKKLEGDQDQIKHMESVLEKMEAAEKRIGEYRKEAEANMEIQREAVEILRKNEKSKK